MSTFVTVASLSELGPGKTKRVHVDGHPILLANVEDQIYACDDLCTHEDSSLYLGCLKGELISCTLHGSRFNVRTGEPQDPPATIPLKTYDVRVEEDDVQINPEARS
ncbi:MAG: non-heme iron oxygenase ferredoxin subunit [Gammaproteobacteria bacterium]|jgi:3-phenylpropionate/trans-cinnamate dioxygenase ferredoxin subunit|nr:non-heme iron oxygenase ferredoxin subunit [Gammaproteobacteria bacterium]